MSNDNEEDWDSEIKGRTRTFVLNYCTDSLCFFNGKRSYELAFTKIKDGIPVFIPSEETCEVNASRLLRNAKVKKAVSKLLKQTQQEADTENAYRLLHDLVIQATYNPAEMVDDMGMLVKPLKELGELAKCIAQIIPTKDGIKYVLADRTKAQEKLLKYYNLIRETDVQQAALPVIVLNGKEATTEAWNNENSDSPGEANSLEAAT